MYFEKRVRIRSSFSFCKQICQQNCSGLKIVDRGGIVLRLLLFLIIKQIQQRQQHRSACWTHPRSNGRGKGVSSITTSAPSVHTNVWRPTSSSRPPVTLTRVQTEDPIRRGLATTRRRSVAIVSCVALLTIYNYESFKLISFILPINRRSVINNFYIVWI